MKFVQGINFHASAGFKYLISEGYEPFDFATDRYIGDLLRIQSYSVTSGQKFYFVYPIRTPHGNMQVFGSGEIVRSLQQDRPVVVSFLQYFACNLSDSVRFGMNFEEFFKKNGVTYQEMFAKSQTDQPLTPPSLPITTSDTIEDNLSEYADLQEQFDPRGPKIKIYVATLEEGLVKLNNIMLSPNVIRWAFSAILTPLDAEYPQKIIIIYGKPPRPQLNSAPSSLVTFLRSKQESIVRQFLQFIVNEKKLDPALESFELLDTQKLDELEELLVKFVKQYPQTKAMSDNTKAFYLTVKKQIVDLGVKKNPTPLELASIDRLLIDYETSLKSSAVFDTSLVVTHSFSEDAVSECLANFSSDQLQKILDAKSTVIVGNEMLKKEMAKKIQGTKDVVANFWTHEFKGYPQVVLPVEQVIMKVGAEPFVSTGVQKTIELISTANFDDAVKYVKVFTDRVSIVVVRPTNLQEKTRSDLAVKGVSSLQEILSKLQEPLDRLELEKLEDPVKSFYKMEDTLISTVKEYLTSLVGYDKNHGNLLTENNYIKALDTLKALMTAANGKQQKALDDRRKKAQEALDSEKKRLDEQYNALKSAVKSRGTLSFLYR